ncbi:MAG TPA: hypothetical protein VER77_01090 [Candidatus Dormibacteraeota bacterium]|nr:hypothetical protein [Candidatus Dormibacteraeota bacterium]
MNGPSYLKLAARPEGREAVHQEDVGYFFINNFLLSRIDSDMPSDLAEYDEDVNVYTAALLSGVVSGREDLLRADLVSPRDADVFARVQDSKDQRYRYRVYKANADFLYVSLGVFSEPSAGVDPMRASDSEANRLTGRGKSYYQFASAYAERLYGSKAGITEVMDKLSRNFEAYTKVMTWMSGEYLNLVRRLSEGEVFHIERQAQERFEDEHRRSTWNALLDGYVDWQKTHARDARRRLARAARELKRLDPSFSLKVFREKWGPPRRG